MAYGAVTQEYDAKGNALVVDSNNNWVLPTHWFYSSFLANNSPPDQNQIILQQNSQTNPSTNQPYNYRMVPAVPKNSASFSGSTTAPASPCTPSQSGDYKYITPTSYPTTGNTNCNLYIVKDPTSLTPNASYKNAGQSGGCFTPSATPGYQYAALSCQNYVGHTYAFFWNDMGGNVDDTDYANGSLEIACSASSYVTLIN